MKLRQFFLGALFFSVQAGVGCAADFVVPSGTTVITTQSLLDDGDTGLIEEGGTIDSSFIGVQMFNTNQTVTNQGTIKTLLFGGYGIDNNFGANKIINNSGTIETNSGDAYGILNNTSDVVINNSGLIQANSDASGIYLNSADNVLINNSGIIRTNASNFDNGIFVQSPTNVTINNTGTIQSSGTSSSAVYIQGGSNATINNEGLITTSGSVSNGIYNNSADNVKITNSGTIQTVGDNANGILSSSSNSLIINTGIIKTAGATANGISNNPADGVTVQNFGNVSVAGTGSIGINAGGDNFTLINGGTVASTDSYALRFSGSNPTLALAAGSIIIGEVESTNSLNATFQDPMNVILTLTEDSGGFGTVTSSGTSVQSSSAASFSSEGMLSEAILLGNTLVVLDSRSFGAQTDIFADVSNTFLNGALRSDRISCCQYAADGYGFWAEGIGSFRDWNGSLDSFNYRQGGILTGLDKIAGDSVLRVFGGALFGDTYPKKVYSGFHTRSVSYVGGIVMEQTFYRGKWDLALTAGHLHFDQKRSILDNLAPDGIAEGKGKRGGVLCATEVSYRRDLNYEYASPYLKAAIRCAGLYLDSYQEQGSRDQLHLRHRAISLLTPQLLCGLPFGVSDPEKSFQADPYIGLAGRLQLSGISERGDVLGQFVSFTANDKKNLLLFLYGVKTCRNWGSLQFKLDFEGSYEWNRGQRYLGSAGLAYNF